MWMSDEFITCIYIFANVCLKLKLTDCRFTCHYRCRALIRLDCCWDRGSLAEHTCVVEHTIETDTNVVRTFEFWQHDWLRTSIFKKLNPYGALIVTIKNKTIRG